MFLVRIRTITVPANDKELIRKTAAGPIAATRIPTIAGPITRPIFNATPFNVIALLISLRGTVPSKNVENAGVLIASPSPSRKISTKRIAGEINLQVLLWQVLELLPACSAD